MIKKYKIKPYHSYYYHRRKKLVVFRVCLMLLMLGVVCVGIYALNRDAIETVFYRIQQAEQEPILETGLYLEPSDIDYDLYHEDFEAKALYLPAGHMSKLESLIDIANTTQVNALVVDIKDDNGYLTFETTNPNLTHMNRTKPPIEDMEQLMDRLYEENIYPIARIVTFKDKVMATEDPERMVQTKQGDVFETSKEETWLDPYNKENWDYILEVCEEAVQLGFKEIQFDYIRFHESMKDSECDFPEDITRVEIITEFVEYATNYLHGLGVVVSADVFGAIITSKIDANIVGQDYKELIKHLDYICPMIYPSHYAEGSFGIEHPDLQPYDLILAVMQYSNNILKEIPRNERNAKVRPWLQDFTASWINPHQEYGSEEINEQIQATYDALTNEWILWNGAGNYHHEGIPVQ